MAIRAKSINKLDQLPGEALDRIAQLRLQFIARCKENMVQIEQVLKERNGTNGRARQDPELIKLAHSLAGASAIFGYSKLGRVAFKVEATLREDHYLEADFTQVIGELIEQLSALG